MKLRHLLASLALSLSPTAFAAGEHHDHEPLHGGLVVETKEADFELVARPESITLYVRDHGKPMSTQGATGKMTLLNGSDKSEAVLAPAGDNRLAAQGSFKVGSGTKLVATVTLAGGKPMNARFAVK